MTKHEFYAILEEIGEAVPGTIKGNEHIESLGWDSLHTLAFQAMADEKFGLSVSPDTMAKFKTVQDVVDLFGNHIQG